MKIAVIKSKNGILSASDPTKSFLIGFKNSSYANMVARTLPPSPSLHIERFTAINIGFDVKKGLTNVGIPSDFFANDIYVDIDAKITFPRLHALSGYDSDCDDFIPYEVDYMLYEDFMMLPFEKNWGIMMPLDMESDRPDGYIFTGHLVEATIAPKLFQEPPTLSI